MARKILSTHNIDALTRDELVIAEAGRNAWDTITKTFATWTVLGEAIVMFRTKAKAITGRQTFQRLLDQNGLGKIDGGEISRLEKIMANLDAVRIWYAKLAQNQKIAWASPSSVIRHAIGPDGKRLFAAKKKGGGKNKTVIKPPVAANDSVLDAANERVKEQLEEELANSRDGKDFKNWPLAERRQFVTNATIDLLIKSAAPAEQEKLRKVSKAGEPSPDAKLESLLADAIAALNRCYKSLGSNEADIESELSADLYAWRRRHVGSKITPKAEPKALKWEMTSKTKNGQVTYDANTPVGRYAISPSWNLSSSLIGYSAALWPLGDYHPSKGKQIFIASKCKTADEAKAAAQKHYDANASAA